MSLRGLFVTGTDTGVGKTWVACGIVRRLLGQGHRVGVMKPIATSAVVTSKGPPASPDAIELRLSLGDETPLARINPILLEGDVAPSVAIRKTGRFEDRSTIVRATREGIAWWSDRCEILVVEGVGGWLCPLADDATVADLAEAIDFPVVVVARLGLGTLNHTLLTIESIGRRGCRVAGVVLNGSEPMTNADAEETNPAELSRWLGSIPILGVLPYSPRIETLSGAMHGVDWWGWAARSRSGPVESP